MSFLEWSPCSSRKRFRKDVRNWGTFKLLIPKRRRDPQQMLRWVQVSVQFTPKFLSKFLLQRLCALVPDWREDGSQLPVRGVGRQEGPPRLGPWQTLQPPCWPLSCPAYDNFKLSSLENLRNEPSFLPRTIKKPGEIDVALSCRTEEVQTSEFLCLLPLNST